MSEKKRNIFTVQFRAKVVQEAIRGDKSLNESGSVLCVYSAQFGLWKKERSRNLRYEAMAETT